MLTDAANPGWLSTYPPARSDKRKVRQEDDDHLPGVSKLPPWQTQNAGVHGYPYILPPTFATGRKPDGKKRPFRCEEPGCTKRYTAVSSLNRHHKKVHGL